MRVTVHFVDGERLDGEAEKVSLERGGFSLAGTGGNTRSAWVGASAIKYVVVHAASEETYERDPREDGGLVRVVLHFLNGEIRRSYRDTTYSEQPGGFVLRLFDEDSKTLQKAMVPGTSLKGVFVVDQWDSRTAAEKKARSGPRRRPPEPAPRVRPAVVEAAQPTVAAAVPSSPQPDPVPPVEPEAEPEADPAVAATGASGSPADLLDVLAEPLEAEEPVEVAEPVGVAELATSEALVLATRYDPEERRQGFVAGLAKRRRPEEDGTLTPSQERHLALKLRISEVLGTLAPDGTEGNPST